MSQRLTLYDLEGRVVRTLVLNSPGSVPQTVQLDNLVTGSYIVRSELYSATALGGVLTGILEHPLSVQGITELNTAVGAAIRSVAVRPDSKTLRVPESDRLYPVALADGNIETFSQPADFQWSVLGGVATVSQSGRVTAVSEGSGSVRATHVPTGHRGSAALTIQPNQPVTSKWTIFVYLNAANDLYSYSVPNMNQMERMANNPEVRYVVQWKQTQRVWGNSSFDGTRRYLVTPDSTSTITSQLVQDLGAGVDMGSPNTLNQFVTWAKAYYPAQRYGLIVWNHGNGWRRTADRFGSGPLAASYDDDTGNAIQTWQMGQALAGHHFDFLAWDCSLMQMMEVAFECKDFADYIVGSEESPPAEGYPYDTVLAPFVANPDAATATLCRSFVDGMLGVPGYSGRKITQSVLETAKLSTLATRIDALAAQLITHRTAIAATIQSIRAQAQSYSPTGIRYYRDLDDLCARLVAAAIPDSIKTAATNVRSALAAAVVHEGHNAQSSGSRGLSIDFSPGSVFLGAAADYGNLKLSQQTRWDNWLTVAP